MIDDSDIPTDDGSSFAGEEPVFPDSVDGLDDKILTEHEISSLMNLDSGNENALISILNNGMVFYERLPMLEVVFDRLVRLMSTSLRNFTSDNVEVSLDAITSIRFGDYINSIPVPAIVNIFQAQEWDNFGLVVMDSALIYSVIDVLLGGRRGVAPMQLEKRPFTTIERNLLERLVHLFLSDLSAAFDPISPVTFRFDRMETNPRFATIARPANAAFLVKLYVEIDDRGGGIELVFPNATLEPIRDLLLQTFMGEKFGRDSIWESHLANQLWQTDFYLDAVLDQLTLPLKEVMEWQVGSTILLNRQPDSPVFLSCADKPMFMGQMGRKSNHISIKIDQVLFGKKEDDYE